MYDRILELIAESSAKRKAATRGKLGSGEKVRAAAGPQKVDPLQVKQKRKEVENKKPKRPQYLERPSQKFYDRIGKVIPGVAKLSAAIKGERERRIKKGKEGKDPRTAYERGLAGRGETVVGRTSRALRGLRNPEKALEKPSGRVF